MNKERAIKILEETILLKQVFEYISAHYELSPNPQDKVRIGSFINEAAENLKLTKNPQFWNAVNIATKRSGFIRVKVQGKNMYKYMKLKEIV